MATEPFSLAVDGGHTVSGLFDIPPQAIACVVLAHGAGAGMFHPFMDDLAAGLAEFGLATLRFQFPYMERRSRRPDTPRVAQATVRAAVDAAARRAAGLPLFAGGKSFGGRMTSQAQAALPLRGVRGLIFLGFPLHPAGRPSTDRAAHLSEVRVPMLFLQGARDALADGELLAGVIARLGGRATLQLFADADHSFHVPARSGRSDREVLTGLLAATRKWTGELISR